mmetsp:Transcript_49114/g.98503  ORF Transcript_49114/g.98503 Transcript_49114/m.98503 type:complete len:82 (-) Transcript_49114:657-902(-)
MWSWGEIDLHTVPSGKLLLVRGRTGPSTIVGDAWIWDDAADSWQLQGTDLVPGRHESEGELVGGRPPPVQRPRRRRNRRLA